MDDFDFEARVEALSHEHRATLVSIGRYRRLVDYASAAMTFLADNVLLEVPLRPEHLKGGAAGAWGEAPLIGAVYAHLNRFIRDHAVPVVLVKGVGRAGDPMAANLWVDGTLEAVDPRYARTRDGFLALLTEFFWPRPFLARAGRAPAVQDHHGQAMYYAMAVARLDPQSIVACVVSSEAPQCWPEPGPAEAPWLINDLLDNRAGVVLPIVSCAGSEEEAAQRFQTLGYHVRRVDAGFRFEARMLAALEEALERLQEVRRTPPAERPDPPGWPLLLVSMPLALGMPPELRDGVEAAGADAPALVEQWLRAYHVEKLLDAEGGPARDVLDLCPPGDLRIGARVLAAAQRLASAG